MAHRLIGQFNPNGGFLKNMLISFNDSKNLLAQTKTREGLFLVADTL